jgi:deoxyribodipyrimidine photo-lyase
VLKEDLEALNISLVVLTANSVAQVPQLIQEASQKLECHSVHWNIEYEVNESKRDATAKTLLQDVSIDCYQHHDQCIVTPGTVLTKEGKTYTIFTPFKKRLNHLNQEINSS